jgi:sugar lactone lactonase YvrE
LAAAFIVLCWSLAAYSQPLSFATAAGYAGRGSADGFGGGAQFGLTQSVASDTNGNVYVADSANNTIRKITAGAVITLAGYPGVSGSADGAGSSARFFQPSGIAVDGSGNVYVADSGNNTIRKITPGGVASTLAGLAGISGSTDGTGTNALFNQPQGLAVDGSGNVLVADYGNHTIRKVTAGGVVSTLAGRAGTFGSANGTGTNAYFYQPQGVAVDGSGNVYVADSANHTIRVITPAGVVSTLAGFAGSFGGSDGAGTNALFYQPQGVAVDHSGNVYVADTLNNTIRKIATGGVVSTLAGQAGNFGSADGTNSSVRFWGPHAVAASGSGSVTLYVADTLNGTIRQMNVSGAAWTVSTLAGSASAGSLDGPAGSARFSWPQGAAADGAGNMYVADTVNGTIRKVAAGLVSTYAGFAGNFGSADGTGTNAQFKGAQGMAVDNAGNVYVADTANGTIRMISAGGVVTTMAGSAGTFGSVDGEGTNAQFNLPEGVAVDSSGDVYVADTGNGTIREVSAGGVVSTLAGLAGSPGSADGTNSSALFNWPTAVAVDPSGNVYVSDTWNHTIRQLSPTGGNWVVNTLAGQAGSWGDADGTNSSARFYLPRGLAVDSAGNVYVADSGNQTIRKLTPAGTNWVVSTVGGVSGLSGGADGTGGGALFDYPAGLTMDSSNNLYLADSANDTLRLGSLITNQAPTIIDQPQGQAAAPGSIVFFSVTATGMSPLRYQWYYNGAGIPGAVAAQYTITNVQSGEVGAYSVVVSNQVGKATSASASLSVGGAPYIVSQPQGQIAAVGQSASFSVTAGGPTPLSYQWLFNGTAIAGATTPSYTVLSVQVTNQGPYAVSVTNPFGAVTSSSAVLGVLAIEAFGDNTWGELDGPSMATNVIAVAAGAWHSLALAANGQVWAWGNDVNGQCDVPAGLNALAVAAGGYHSLAIRADGTVAAWGNNNYGQCNVPAHLSQVVAIAAGTWHSLALRANGQLVAWGDNTWNQTNVPAGLSNVVAIAAGGGHNLALQSNGTVVAWGQDTDSLGNFAGQSDVPPGLTNAVAIGAGDYHSLVARADGSLAAWGDNAQGQCTIPTGLGWIVAVAGGGAHSVALASNGVVSAWGSDSSGQCDLGSYAVNCAAVAAGEEDTVMLEAGNVPVAQMIAPAWQLGQFSVLFQTLSREHYTLQYENSLSATGWIAFPAVSGNGALRLFVDRSAPASGRFYRVQQR